MISKTVTVGLCKGRHDIPYVNNSYIFESIDDPTDLKEIESKIQLWYNQHKECKSIKLYVTGLTVALIEVINFCYEYGIDLKLYHFNSQTKKYFSQTLSF